MAKYLARYTVNAYMFDGGAFMPEPHKPEYAFEARDQTEANEKAKDYMTSLRKEYFGPRITLDSLLEIREVRLLRTQII